VDGCRRGGAWPDAAELASPAERWPGRQRRVVAAGGTGGAGAGNGRCTRKGRSKMPFVVDQHPVGALGSCGAYPSLRVTVRAWRLLQRRHGTRCCNSRGGRVARSSRTAGRRRYQRKISMPSARVLHRSCARASCHAGQRGARARRGIRGIGGAVATARESIVVNRPCAETFAYLTDPRTRHEWRPQVARIELLRDGEVGAGTQAVEVRRMFGREVRVPLEITRHEPPNRQDIRTTIRGLKGSRDRPDSSSVQRRGHRSAANLLIARHGPGRQGASLRQTR
jgi:Polyketide cyclase / dehydrase and lipid transport